MSSFELLSNNEITVLSIIMQKYLFRQDLQAITTAQQDSALALESDDDAGTEVAEHAGSSQASQLQMQMRRKLFDAIEIMGRGLVERDTEVRTVSLVR